MTSKRTPEYLAKRREWYKAERHRILPKLAEIRRANPKKYMLKDAKRRSKDKGIECSITENDFDIPKTCPISLIELQCNVGGLKPNSPTLDRIDNSKGYIQGNVRVISNRANAMKRDADIPEIER